MLPNFIVIGAAKCATTSLCRLLKMHPDIFFSEPKELHYFSSLIGSNTFPGSPDAKINLDWYKERFADAGDCIAIGEGSTSYTAPERIHRAVRQMYEVIPGCKLIYIVRDPIARLESDWRMRLHEGWSRESINAAVLYQPQLVTAGLYWFNISQYREVYPDEQIKVIFLEDFHQRPEDILGECFEYLGVDPSFREKIDIEQRHNTSTAYRDFNPLVRKFIKGDFWKSVREAAPESLVNAGRKLLSSPKVIDVKWEPQLLESVRAELRPDAERFLKFYDKPFDFWPMRSGDGQ